MYFRIRTGASLTSLRNANCATGNGVPDEYRQRVIVTCGGTTYAINMVNLAVTTLFNHGGKWLPPVLLNEMQLLTFIKDGITKMSVLNLNLENLPHNNHTELIQNISGGPGTVKKLGAVSGAVYLNVRSLIVSKNNPFNIYIIDGDRFNRISLAEDRVSSPWQINDAGFRNFKPRFIKEHPITGDIYVTSTQWATIIRINKDLNFYDRPKYLNAFIISVFKHLSVPQGNLRWADWAFIGSRLLLPDKVSGSVLLTPHEPGTHDPREIWTTDSAVKEMTPTWIKFDPDLAGLGVYKQNLLIVDKKGIRIIKRE